MHGIEALLKCIEEESRGSDKRNRLEEKVAGYMKRAEAIKDRIAKDSRLVSGETRRTHQTTIAIPENGIGFRSVTSACKSLSSPVTKCSSTRISAPPRRFESLSPAVPHSRQVVLRDPYLRRPHQLHNLVRFCELCVRRGVSSIAIVTGSDDDREAQTRALEELKSSLSTRKVVLSYSYDDVLHDRDLAVDNGWFIRLGRGLDIFKRCEGVYVIGSHDYDQRPCFACNIDVWRDS
jgi:hypothetical protein